MKHFFNKIIKNKFFPKIGSLCFGILLWYYNHDIQILSKSITLPVKFINYPKNLFTKENLSKKTAILKLNGYAKDIDPIILSKNHIELIADLKNAKIGIKNYPIKIKTNEVIENLLSKTVYEINSNYTKLEFERNIKKLVKIKLILKNVEKFKEDILDIQYSPNNIEISGPEKSIKDIRTIETEEVMLEKNMDLLLIPIRKLDVQNINYSSDKIKIHIFWNQLKKIQLEKIPIKVENLKEFEFLKNSIKKLEMEYIIYSGDKNNLPFLKSKKSISCNIKLDRKTDKNYIFSIVINPINNFTIIDYKPKKITIPLYSKE